VGYRPRILFFAKTNIDLQAVIPAQAKVELMRMRASVAVIITNTAIYANILHLVYQQTYLMVCLPVW
jgi:hypothetical protein